MTTTITLGCRLNIAESSTIAEMLDTAGEEKTVVVNTCSVTADATRKSLQAARRALRRHPNRPVVATGCAVETSTDRFAQIKGLKLVANRRKLQPSAWGLRRTKGAVAAFGAPEGHVRGFLQAQQGCDHSCTFCSIPQGRGKAGDITIEDCSQLAKRLVRRGYGEITVTGVDIASWGGGRLGDLMEGLLERVPRARRWRLSSLDPAAIDPKLERLLICEPRLMPHAHLSVQAGDDLILKRMKRRHHRGQVIELCRRLTAGRRAVLGEEMSLGADFICGFPTESDERFANTMALVDECGLGFLHVFPYSSLPDTPAARMPQVAPATAGRRAAMLRQRGARWRLRHFRRQVGKRLEVLAETPRWGRSPCYGRVRLLEETEPGKTVNLRITSANADFMTGQ